MEKVYHNTTMRLGRLTMQGRQIRRKPPDLNTAIEQGGKTIDRDLLRDTAQQF